jgi:hypothetical protein
MGTHLRPHFCLSRFRYRERIKEDVYNRKLKWILAAIAILFVVQYFVILRKKPERIGNAPSIMTPFREIAK